MRVAKSNKHGWRSAYGLRKKKACACVALKLSVGEELSIVNNRDAHKSTGLHYTAWRGYVAICRAILAHREFNDMNLMESVERTVLHYASEKHF